MAQKQIELLRRDECQPLTTEQIEDIKSQFHPQADGSNVNITPYHIYDEDEHVVGEWQEMRDGVLKQKPVYQKVVSINNASKGNIYTGDFTIEQLISVGGSFLNNSDVIPWNGYFWSELEYSSIYIEGGTNVYWSTKFSNKSGKLILEYTKTTDEWQPV